MFQKIVTSALFAGFCAGLIAALLQLVFVQPVLLQAELYESGKLVHFGAEAVAALPVVGGIDVMRDGLSILFTIFAYTGYALILVALMSTASERGITINARKGLMWGLCGFFAAQLAPAFSLPPEVPGVAAADVAQRQVWWFATVAAAVIALGLIAFGKSRVAWAGAVVLLIAPHLIGAPQPDSFTGPAPPEVAALFASRALGIGLVAWALVGLFSGYFWHRYSADT